jgi:hypothetical protein
VPVGLAGLAPAAAAAAAAAAFVYSVCSVQTKLCAVTRRLGSAPSSAKGVKLTKSDIIWGLLVELIEEVHQRRRDLWHAEGGIFEREGGREGEVFGRHNTFAPFSIMPWNSFDDTAFTAPPVASQSWATYMCACAYRVPCGSRASRTHINQEAYNPRDQERILALGRSSMREQWIWCCAVG